MIRRKPEREEITGGAMDIKKEAILKAAGDLTENYDREELFMPKNGRSLPNRAVIIDLVRDLRAVIFPGYFLSLIHI